MAKAKSWANKSEMLIGGFGPGPGATLPQDRGRDVARYEQMKATLPKKPPSQLRPRDSKSDDNTEVAEAAV